MNKVFMYFLVGRFIFITVVTSFCLSNVSLFEWPESLCVFVCLFVCSFLTVHLGAGLPDPLNPLDFVRVETQTCICT